VGIREVIYRRGSVIRLREQDFDGEWDGLPACRSTHSGCSGVVSMTSISSHNRPAVVCTTPSEPGLAINPDTPLGAKYWALQPAADGRIGLSRDSGSCPAQRACAMTTRSSRFSKRWLSVGRTAAHYAVGLAKLGGLSCTEPCPQQIPMTPHEFGLYFHHNLFRLACYERKGAAFQTFFEDIMGLHDPSF
jgi:hypothetical protein